MKVNVQNIKGDSVEELEINFDSFDDDSKGLQAVHDAVVAYRASSAVEPLVPRHVRKSLEQVRSLGGKKEPGVLVPAPSSPPYGEVVVSFLAHVRAVFEKISKMKVETVILVSGQFTGL